MAANYYNERSDKIISVHHQSELINTGVAKFGSLVGDHCKIGANAVLSPGTILLPGAVVRRLELVAQ
jgi:acetyltransferase-like isoleucine patch superfamily enzyme